MKLGDLIALVSKEAGLDVCAADPLVVRDWINQALCKAQEVRPELFTETVTQSATDSDIQSASCGQQILSVEAINGRPVLPRDPKLRRLAAMLKSCSTDHQVYVDPVVLTDFNVTPPLTSADEVTLRVSKIPNYGDDLEADACIACSQMNIIRAWLRIVIAKTTDQDSAAGQQMIQQLQATFYGQIKAAQQTIYSMRKAAA